MQLMMTGINFDMNYPSPERAELDSLRKIWDKFKSLMLQRQYAGLASVVQSLFISELCKCSSDFQNDLGILACHLRTFDSFLARFEDQCMLRIFLLFERFKLIFLQTNYDGSEPGWEEEAEGSNVNEKIKFSFCPTNSGSIQDDFILIKDDVSSTCEKNEMNEEIRTCSVFVAAEDRNEKDHVAVSSAIRADCSHSESVGEQTSPDMSSVQRLQNNKNNETLTGNCNNFNTSFMTNPHKNSDNEILTGNCKNVNIFPVRRLQNNTNTNTKTTNNSNNKILTENCNSVISIHEKSHYSVPKHLKGKILPDFHHKEIKQGKTSSMKSDLHSSFYHKNSKGVVNCPEKLTHTLGHRLIKGTIHCMKCGFVDETARLFNEPVNPHAKVIAELCCCNCSAVFMPETNLASSSDCNVSCKQQRESKPESPSFLDNKFSTSDELPKQNSSDKMCGSVSADRPRCNNHRRSYPRNKQFKCGIYGAEFSESTKLKTHKLVHIGEKQFICEVCGASFSILSTLKNHMRIHSDEKPYKCDICDFASTHSSNLKVHLLIHSGEKKYSCDKCGSCFTDNAKLKRHIMVHTGEKPYRCEACGVAFADKSHLTVHRRIHSGETPFKCTICSAAFVESSKLKIHLRKHTGEKPYMCEICGMSFAVAYGLRSHMRRHTGEKLYKCNICAYASSQSSNLKTHMYVHNGARPHVCEMCGAGFSESSKLTRHSVTHLD